MKNTFLLFVFITIAFTACKFFNPYGKKVTINKYVEVYYSGDSTTEADAKKLGNYIADTWKDQTNEKSFQVVKENANSYIVKMVIDKDVFKKDSTLDVGFAAVRLLIATQVYNNAKVKLIVTDNKFNPIKTYEENENETKVILDENGKNDSTNTNK